MHKWLLNVQFKPIHIRYKENDLQKVFEFCKNIREYVKEPSPTIMLCEKFILNTTGMKVGGCYILSPTMELLLSLDRNTKSIDSNLKALTL
jgi:hypothetical protein